jgi:eukaryotic-like serine/threonine-protein kinase
MFNPGNLIGKEIDQFRLEEFIGQGAMGMVYKAKDTILNRTVALKLISKKVEFTTPAMAEARKRLIQEAQAAGRLAHPNIVTIHSYGETDEFQYICMEYIIGRTLAEVLNEVKVLAVEEAVSIFDQILQALEISSQEQIVHRDIKPTNIMILGDHRVKVMDFGIAKIPSLSITTTGTVLGTPYYMSPEQISGQKVDIRSDLFSVGAVFYQVLTGERPFEGESTVTLAYKIVQVEPIPPKVLNVHIPPAIETIVKKALTKDPTLRYQTPTEMLKDLRSALRPSPAPTPAVSDTTIKTKSALSFEKTVEFKAGDKPARVEEKAKTPERKAAPVEEKPQPVVAPKEPVPRAVPTAKPAASPPRAQTGNPASKTIALSLVLLLVMVVGIVLVVRLVKKSSSDLPPSLGKPAETVPATPGASPGAQTKIQLDKLLQQAKNETQTDPANAQKLLEQAVQLDPKNFDAQFQTARLFTLRKNFPAAIEHYQAAMQINNQVPEIPFNLGFIYLNQGDYDLAIKYYESCRALSPPYQDEVLTNLGIAFLKKNNPTQAQTYFKQAIGLNPNNSLARSYLQSNLSVGAAAPPPTPPGTDPKAEEKRQATALVNQAKSQLNANPAQAQKLLEKAASLDPTNYEVPYQLGRILTFKKEYAGAVLYYQKAINLNAKIPEIHFNLGYIYMSQGNFDQAIKSFDSCRALSPPFQDEVLTNLGISYLRKNNPAQAQIYFREALKINPNNSLARSHLQNLGG